MTARLTGALAALAALAIAAPALAGHAVLVLPVDGSADAATRTRLTNELVKLARTSAADRDTQVSKSDTTFAEAALAVGCNARSPRCSDQLLSTLAIDELIWATADRDAGQVVLIVRRASKGTPPRERTATLAAADVEHIDAQLAPLFQPAAPAGEPPAPPAPAASAEPASLGDPPERRDRGRGIALATGGGIILAVGVALWIDYASLQSSINGHATHDLADFADLRALEDRAQTAAISGDILVPIGLAIGAAGAYFLYRSRAPSVAIAPGPIGLGKSFGLTLTLSGGGL